MAAAATAMQPITACFRTNKLISAAIMQAYASTAVRPFDKSLVPDTLPHVEGLTVCRGFIKDDTSTMSNFLAEEGSNAAFKNILDTIMELAGHVAETRPVLDVSIAVAPLFSETGYHGANSKECWRTEFNYMDTLIQMFYRQKPKFDLHLYHGCYKDHEQAVVSL